VRASSRSTSRAKGKGKGKGSRGEDSSRVLRGGEGVDGRLVGLMGGGTWILLGGIEGSG